MTWRGRDVEDDIQGLLTRVGVAEAGSSPTEGLGQEPILVFYGGWRQALGIYARNGSKIGEAVRIEDSYSEVGYRYHYQLRDSQLRCVLRDMTRRRFGVDSWSYAFSVLGANEAEIATIRQSGRSNDSWVIACDGRPVAAVDRLSRTKALSEKTSAAMPTTLIGRGQRLFDRVTKHVWCIEDEPGHPVARITYLVPMNPFGRDVAYVLEREPSLDEPLRTIALTACIVADNRIINRGGRGGGA